MRQQTPLQAKLNEVIFGTETRAGNGFDLILIFAILASVSVVVLDSIQTYHQKYGTFFFFAEWLFTIMFTIEYGMRIYCAPNRKKYMRSFFGVVDLLAILPSYIGLFIPSANFLISIRILRVLRIFRILRLFRYLSEANILIRSMIMSRRKILVFLFSVLVLITFFGSLMFIIEGPEHGFTSIPRSIYWAIVTITTVGYGDITPQTVLGQTIASMAMLTGYAIIAVPTGIITAELAQEIQRTKAVSFCKSCTRAGHDSDADFCKFCGEKLPDGSENRHD